jgi:hypothetical protein
MTTPTTNRREAVHVMQHGLRQVMSAKQNEELAHHLHEQRALKLLSDMRLWRTNKGIRPEPVAAALKMTVQELFDLEDGQFGTLSLQDDAFMRTWYHAIRLPYIDDRWFRDGDGWVIEPPSVETQP